MKDIEVELKFRLADKETLLNFLQANATLTKESSQKDSYFAPSHRDFFAKKPINEWLRVRESSKGDSINYKNWKEKAGENLNYCDEYESKLENPDEVKNILLALDIKPVIIVKKVRKSFLYHDIEISVDEVEELGGFVELEMKGEFDSPEAAKEKLRMVADEL
ncbi:MAG: class IV adenylate cyclase [Candidatus Peribacteria bacterium]|jgi:adenylate cyclase class 2|nr:class IV adenylate cyclase [Candidatus Peribacteria bacterium]